MVKTHVLLSIGWLLYCLLHSLLANEIVKLHLQNLFKLSNNVYRVCYNIFALITLIALLWYQFTSDSIQLFNVGIVQNMLAPIIGFFGLAGMIVCIKKYFMQLSGLAKKDVLPLPVLETGGIHKFVRHPLYIFTFIFLTGLLLWQPYLSNLVAVMVIIVYTVIGIRFEEQKLINEFGDNYRDYKKKVPMLIPFTK